MGQLMERVHGGLNDLPLPPQAGLFRAAREGDSVLGARAGGDEGGPGLGHVIQRDRLAAQII